MYYNILPWLYCKLLDADLPIETSNDDLECECKVKTLGEIRNHIETNHKHGHFNHMKLKRNDANEVTVKKYWYDSKGKVK